MYRSERTTAAPQQQRVYSWVCVVCKLVHICICMAREYEETQMIENWHGKKHNISLHMRF